MKETDRLIFERLSEKHFDHYCELELDPVVMKYYTSRPHGSVEHARTSFNRYKEYMEKHPELGVFVAFSKEAREFVGLGIVIHLELDPVTGSHEIGYRLPVRSWGKGYATEIATALVDYGFKTLGLERILGTTHPENVASQRVLLKCGFKNAGTVPNYGGSSLFEVMNDRSE